ncbi:hypothetical protein NEMIN01_1785 [Nematocida minor]|uniref:uncharacterized protein n=1 Tax=Nematocida minor TaxID=1912983 RepID=UPI00221F963F|nr:uncharacterized protein NEMIN01_1785 [Nematocida minor]KAI5192037.1 hypothetical protein NEMIN01_1785 [Nematocida minor]
MLVEVLDGIGGCLIYIENEEYSEDNSVIAALLANEHKIYRESAYTIIRTQNIFSTPEITSLEMKINSELEDRMKSVLKKIACLCGCTEQESKTVLRLPAEGWEELVDMWSCHNREFGHLVEQEMNPKKDGVLYSTLHLIMEAERAPKCLIARNNCDSLESAPKTLKIFYNEIKMCLSDEYLLFHYLYDLFQIRQEIEIAAEKMYTIRLLDITYTYHGKIAHSPPLDLSLKIAYTSRPIGTENAENPSKPKEESKCNINAYYTDKLIEVLLKNSIGIEMGGRSVSFIRKVRTE